MEQMEPYGEYTTVEDIFIEWLLQHSIPFKLIADVSGYQPIFVLYECDIEERITIWLFAGSQNLFPVVP